MGKVLNLQWLSKSTSEQMLANFFHDFLIMLSKWEQCSICSGFPRVLVNKCLGTDFCEFWRGPLSIQDKDTVAHTCRCIDMFCPRSFLPLY